MSASAHEPTDVVVRRRWVIQGQVQGVGFRPFVYRLAMRCGVRGFVRNDAGGVTIEGQGPADRLERFGRALTAERPSMAVLDRVAAIDIPLVDEGEDFRIDPSVYAGAARAFTASTGESASTAAPAPPTVPQVTVDTALCPACLAELFDNRDRRYRHGLINCTDCGPRFSIIRGVPYDRPNTTMAPFPMCPACRQEYGAPSDRRFHAQPVCCNDCGPTVSLVDHAGYPIRDDPYCAAAHLLEDGRIIAIKGLGGFHLAVRADHPAAVARLRRLKQRDAKPFALMVRNVEAARKIVKLSRSAEAALRSPACPIVLAPRQPQAAVAPRVAPGLDTLGVMLPHTPIQHLLMHEMVYSDALVMTSGNVSDEPMATDNDEALARLGPLCDALLWHDRPIERRVDDSILIDVGEGAPLPVRRARGYAPASIALPVCAMGNPCAGQAPPELGSCCHPTQAGGACQSAEAPGTSAAAEGMGLCVGGELKNTIAVVRGGSAVLSQHIGDLSHPAADEQFRKTIDDMLGLFDAWPQWIAHDLHPVYLSTLYARQLAERWGVPLIGVQHHHAHAAAVLAEHAFTGSVLAVVCDGVGYGSDGTSWGGELLLADLTDFRRLAHLKPLLLPGGDAAARDTRRCALALLHAALGEGFDRHRLVPLLVPDLFERRMLVTMLKRGSGCTVSTAAGRLFDGVAALLGVCQQNQFEAQAAMQLQALAELTDDAPLPDAPLYSLTDEGRVIDLSPLVMHLVQGSSQGQPLPGLARLFHEGVAMAWSAAVLEHAQQTGLRTVALSGGVFANRLLLQRLTGLLERSGLRVLRHRVVPPGDGGLALGQAAIATAQWRRGQHPVVPHEFKRDPE